MIRSGLMLVSALIFSGAAVGCQGDAPQAKESAAEQAPPFPGAQGGFVEQAPAVEQVPAAEESAKAATRAEQPPSDPTDVGASELPKQGELPEPHELPEPRELPAHLKVEGVAHNAKLGAVLVAEDGARHWVDLAAWPDEILGQRIALEGVPVFRSDLPIVAPGPRGEQSAGLPQSQGQSAAQAARRQVITEAVWTLVK